MEQITQEEYLYDYFKWLRDAPIDIFNDERVENVIEKGYKGFKKKYYNRIEELGYSDVETIQKVKDGWIVKTGNDKIFVKR